MGKLRKSYIFKVIMVFLAAPLHETVTVSQTLCPTNKIAPHRRVLASGRTFAAYYDLLLVPNTPQSGQQTQNPYPNKPQYGLQTQNPLQEQPQADQPDDCGEIEDYDENDLSYLTQRNGRTTDSRFFFGGLFNRPTKLPPYTTPSQPSVTPIAISPIRPTHFPQRPPYWSGGYFGQNHYQTPSSQEPSDNFKPVHEAADISEVPQTYRPGIVGGPLGHVVGLSQARPTSSPPIQDENTRRRQEYLDNLRRTMQSTAYTTRRPRKLSSDQSVIGSFLDLFF